MDDNERWINCDFANFIGTLSVTYIFGELFS